MSGAVGFPSAPFLDPATGDISDVWRQFLVQVFTRLGTSQVRAPIAITPTGSPFTYAAPYDGALFAAGGGIEAMTLKRGSSAAYAVGSFYGGKPMRAGDLLTISYSAAPTLVFFPG